MRILTIHNRYQQTGGEDMVFEAEGRLLRDMGHSVETLVFDNRDIRSISARLLVALGLIYNFGSAARLRRKLTNFRPDVIHVHNFFPLASPAIFMVGHKFGIPIVLTLHNYRLICPSATLFYNQEIYERSINSVFPFDAVIKGVYRNSKWLTAGAAITFGTHNLLGTWKSKVSQYIVLSEFAREKFRHSRLRLDFGRITVKPNFVFDNGYSGGHERKNMFLFVGRLSVEKGIPTLLKAAKSHRFELMIIGDGDLRQQVLQCADEYSNITYGGLLDKASVLKRMKSCRALIFPSIWYEGFPVTILDAFSTGTPVIASRIGSVAEIVEDNITGLLFNPGDDLDLISKVISLASNSPLATTLGKNARSTYNDKYTPEVNYKILLGIYRKAVTGVQTTCPVHECCAHADPASVMPRRGESLLPKLTIGIPTHNGAARIQRALNSIFVQKYDNLEIIISDNNSRDETQDVCGRNAANHPEILYYRQTTNIGLVPNFEFVRSRAGGKYFMWLSDDDVLEPGILQQCVSFLEKNPDFSMAAGQIIYRSGDLVDYIEGGFNFASSSPVLRLIRYYYKTVYGGMFHGIMRRELAARIPARNVFGNDFHFVASLSYLGKIRNFDFPGYYKSLGGCSKDVHQCARAMGESRLASRFPHFKIAVDAFAEVMYRSPLFSMGFPPRLTIAVLCFLASFIGYYGRIVPLTIAGIIKRNVFSLFKIRNTGSYFKQASFARSKMNIVKEQ